MAKRNEQLILSLDVNTMLEDSGVDDIQSAVNEYAEFMRGEEIPFTQEGSVFTFKGTQNELVEVMYKDQTYWGAGFSFSEEDAVDEIQAQNS